jgi:hypothetical protein
MLSSQLCHVLTVFSDHTEVHYVTTDMQMKRCRMQYTRGCVQLTVFIADGIRKLIDQSKKCKEKLGHFLKK